MAENEFEHKVNGLMEEFKISPSEAVWVNVEKEIREKRRRKILAWLIPACLLLTLCGGYFFVQQYYSPNTSEHALALNEHSSAINKKNKLTEQSNKTTEQKTAVSDTTKTPIDKTQILVDENGQKQLISQETQTNLAIHTKEISSVKGEKAQSAVSLKTGLTYDKKEQSQSNLKLPEQETYATRPKSQLKNDDLKNSLDQITNPTISDQLKSDNLKTGINDNTTGSPSETNEKSIPKQAENKASVKKSSGNKSKIQWGIDAFYGRSDIVQSIFNGSQDKSAMQDYTGGGLSTGPLPQSYASSPVKAGTSLSLGIIAKKDISKRSSISAGLNYSLQKTTINTGSRVDSSRFFYNAVAASFANDFYRIPSDSTGKGAYGNNYQFIQIPVLFNYQINNSKKLPLYLNSGLAASLMINSKSLIYDKTYAVFYSDNNLYKKLQLNFVAGMSAKINLNNSYLVVGPQLQYSTTNLLKNKSYFGSQHLFNYGIRASFFLNKK